MRVLLYLVLDFFLDCQEKIVCRLVHAAREHKILPNHDAEIICDFVK